MKGIICHLPTISDCALCGMYSDGEMDCEHCIIRSKFDDEYKELFTEFDKYDEDPEEEDRRKDYLENYAAEEPYNYDY